MELRENRDFFNILKGIAILAVVIGHVGPNVIPIFAKPENIYVPYVYSFHLALFFFVSGLLFNDEKYRDKPYLVFINRFKRCYLTFFIYCLIVELIFHAIPLRSYYGRKAAYDFSKFLHHALNFLTFRKLPPEANALWFVPPYILASSFFGFVVYVTNKIANYLGNFKMLKNKDYCKLFLIFLFSVLLSLIGYNKAIQKATFLYRAETSLFVLPLLALGYFFRYYIKNLDKVLNFFVFIVFLTLSIFICYFYIPQNYKFPRIDLKYLRYTYLLYYTLAFLGIYQAMYIAKILLKYDFFKIIKSFFSLTGENTFEIMAFHRSVFLGLGYLLILVFGKIKIESTFWYNISIIVFSILPCFLIAYIKHFLSNFMHKKNKN